MAVPQKTLRAKPTPCCTQFKARTWTPAPHPLLAPITANWLFPCLGLILPAKHTLQQSIHVLQRLSQLPARCFTGKEEETGLQTAPVVMLKQGSTCAALRDSQLSHLPGSEQLFLASHPHTPLNTWQIATVCPWFITAFVSGCRALSGSPGAWGSVGISRGLFIGPKNNFMLRQRKKSWNSDPSYLPTVGVSLHRSYST